MGVRHVVAASAVALMLGIGSHADAADLIFNGGFETGDFTGWITGANSFPQYIVTGPVNSGTYAAQIAGYSFNPDTLSQSVTTTPGQTYQLSFARFQSGGGPTISLDVTWDGTTVFSELNPGPGSINLYQTFSGIVVGSGLDSLVFTSANDPAYTYLDNVSLTATPLPAALPLFGSAVIGFAAWGRRLRARKTAA